MEDVLWLLASAGDDGELPAVFPDDKVLSQSVRPDARGQFLDAVD